MLGVIAYEIVQRPGHLFVGCFRSQNSTDQHGGAVADIGGDQVVRDRRQSHVFPGRVHGMRQVEFGIDEGAVEVENEQRHQAGFADHSFFNFSYASWNLSLTSLGVIAARALDAPMTYGSVFDSSIDCGRKATVTVTSTDTTIISRTKPNTAPNKRSSHASPINLNSFARVRPAIAPATKNTPKTIRKPSSFASSRDDIPPRRDRKSVV